MDPRVFRRVQRYGWDAATDAYDRSCGDDGVCMIYKNVQGAYLYTAVSDGFVTKLSSSGDRILY